MLDCKKLFVVLVALLLVNKVAEAQESKVFKNLDLNSEILKKEVAYGIYLPPNYEDSKKLYPVLYLLHGGGGNQGTKRHERLIEEFNIKEKLDEAISKETILPMIVVIPDAGMSYYMNNQNGDYQFEDYFMEELLPHIEADYRCKVGKASRAISGFSMGGFGALLYGIHHPDKFSSVAAIGPAIRTNDQIREMPHDQYLRRYQSVMGKIASDEVRINDFWNSNNLFYLVQNMTEEQKTQVKIQFVIGDDDYLYKGNSELHVLMNDLGIPHEYRVVDGKHVQYFEEEILRALKFINSNLEP